MNGFSPPARSFLLLGFTLLAVSCQVPDLNTQTAGSGKTVSWEADTSGAVHHSTNDPLYYNQTLVKTWGAAGSIPDEIVVRLTKVTGQTTQGYGLVFCYSDSDNYYELLVDATGKFLLQKRVSGKWHRVYAPDGNLCGYPVWYSSSSLDQGLGAQNTIAITHTWDYSRNRLRFYVTFNGDTDHQIAFWGDPNLGARGIGLVTTVGSEDSEQFPGVPEDVLFYVDKPSLASLTCSP